MTSNQDNFIIFFSALSMNKNREIEAKNILRKIKPKTKRKH